MQTHNARWMVSLSTGETIYEEKGEYQTIEGDRSPWGRLLSYLEEKQAVITSLSLYTEDGRRWNLPSAGNNPKFKAFCDAAKPTGFRCFRRLGMDVTGANRSPEEIYTVAEAEYDGAIMQVWVSEADPLVSWNLLTFK